MVLGECGRYPLCIVYFRKCIGYWCRLIYMPQYRKPRNCYDMLKQLDESGRITWITNVKRLLYTYGFGHVWFEQDVGDIKVFLAIFKQRIKDCMFQNWHDNIVNSTRCDTDRHFKSLLNPEKYLTLGLSFSLRRLLARFRCCSNRLNIEIGRHYNIDREDRIGLYCFLSDDFLLVEDEYHVFFICHRFVNERASFLYNWYSGNRERIDFIT